MKNFDFLAVKEVRDFIETNLNENISKLALQKNPFPNLDYKLIINQLEAKSKAKDKLPTWFSTKNIIYPSRISVEQTSSEKTALHKSKLISGKKIIDLTGGFGVDAFYFSKQFSKVIHCEHNLELSEIVKHNFSQLKVDNIQCISGESEEILRKIYEKFDWIYIDPSRRNDVKGKVFMLRDCEPNVPDLLDFYFNYSSNILIKTAPLLDLTAGLKELKNVSAIHIVAVENEVKELLWEINQGFEGNPKIKTVNLTKNKEEKFEFNLGESSVEVSYSEPEKFLFEPNAAIMKSGGFDEVAVQFNLKKLHPHSHLYTSDEKIDFCGRVFEIIEVIPYQKNEIKLHLENKKANITTRNFPETVENIRKKWKINDGGNLYTFFTTDHKNNKIVLLCNKI
ncbi:MAG TPA: class I SAM-dependent methyltransferase [Flavobacterium sp.]|uniref:class I SAM-dependent methyltransferase n=2 Tax=Flavobacterium TaxID=237 RepID=UPI0025BBA998|nr:MULTISPECIES: class I SAM-dependent methyltransferase [unclassified Flavobacterium]HRE78066.1 class I SAM-dependent methyltransferase [Flavobacterium sp.]